MKAQKYSVNQYLIETILAYVSSGDIAIPEIQRPFVWDSTKVRDLLDSLYQGFPIGYIIAWRNPNVRLKDGTFSNGKKILIDGQQRVTALTASLLGQAIINKEYKKVNIQIAFHPIEERFEVFNSAIAKDSSWFPDVSEIINGKARMSKILHDYCQKNNEANIVQVEDAIENLKSIVKKQIGLIELETELDIETVTEIFIRINSKGVVLSQADFVMSKIASNEIYGGNLLRKCIDYFSHLAVAPEFYSHITEIDEEFCKSEFYNKIKWLNKENDDLYDPDYNDILRVSFTKEFNRGKLSDLVSLLSGRNFEQKTFEEEIAECTYKRLTNSVLDFINETNFKRFLMILRSAGFVDSSLIQSKNTINFSYILYLKLRKKGLNDGVIETIVRKWFVLTLLLGRYSGSPESKFDQDIKNFEINDPFEIVEQFENAELSDAFWDIGLVHQLATSNVNSPAYNVYLASCCKLNTPGFLSKDILVKDLIELRGDIHHIFPKDYLKKNGFSKGMYNQIANFVYTQSEINIRIGNKSPKDYFEVLKLQCETKDMKLGSITDFDIILANLQMNDLPFDVINMDFNDYSEFLEKRRMHMAQKIQNFFNQL